MEHLFPSRAFHFVPSEHRSDTNELIESVQNHEARLGYFCHQGSKVFTRKEAMGSLWDPSKAREKRQKRETEKEV